MQKPVPFVVTVIVLAIGLGCAKKVHRELVAPAEIEQLSRYSGILKAHMSDGRLFVLEEWRIDDARRVVNGNGTLYDPKRHPLDTGPFELAVDSVAIFETNVVTSSNALVPLTLITFASLAATAYCASNPKACFGSCPTFYVTDGATPQLVAEGFSASIAPCLEMRDVDALWSVQPQDRRVEITMRNEALETHVVRYVDLLVVPREPGDRVVAQQDGTFLPIRGLIAPSRCRDPDGSCLEAMRAVDGDERWSFADSLDLATREVLELDFDVRPDDGLGLVLTSRQSLLPTYILYQALAYMGREAGAWLATLERQGPQSLSRFQKVLETLGAIEVEVRDEGGQWVSCGRVVETGPLATDTKVVPLRGAGGDRLEVRLRLTRGMWRLDGVMVGRIIGEPAEPLRLRPLAVLADGSLDSEAYRRLHDDQLTLSTLPGDDYTLVYECPSSGMYECFLESRGYYLEWLREEWLAEENPAKVARLLLDPDGALRDMAPGFKQVEASMEEVFWSSRYVAP